MQPGVTIMARYGTKNIGLCAMAKLMTVRG
jgi:hypothetical protein